MRQLNLHLAIGLYAVIRRELTKFTRQKERMISSLVRPLLWLVVFAAGFHNLLGISIIAPYETYTPYQEYILPGLIGIIILFQSMQSALSMVYDREVGVMRVMLVTPLPRSFILFAKIIAASILSVFQVIVFLIVAALLGINTPFSTVVLIVPASFLCGMLLGSIGLATTVYTKQIENFAGIMNFVIFPMFFFSSALYPLWKLRESGAEIVYRVAQINPFTHAVELIRFAAYGKFNLISFAVVFGVCVLSFWLAVRGYNPNTGNIKKVKLS